MANITIDPDEVISVSVHDIGTVLVKWDYKANTMIIEAFPTAGRDISSKKNILGELAILVVKPKESRGDE